MLYLNALSLSLKDQVDKGFLRLVDFVGLVDSRSIGFLNMGLDQLIYESNVNNCESSETLTLAASECRRM